MANLSILCVYTKGVLFCYHITIVLTGQELHINRLLPKRIFLNGYWLPINKIILSCYHSYLSFK